MIHHLILQGKMIDKGVVCMIRNPHEIGSVNFVSELLELSKTQKVAVFPALFFSPPELLIVHKALGIAGQQITAILYDDAYAEARPIPNLGTSFRNEGFRFVDLDGLRQYQEENPATEIVIVSYHLAPKQEFLFSVLDRAGIQCRLYHCLDIPHSLEIHGKLHVLNDIEYLRSWPPVLEKLNGPYVTEAEIERFKHGKYPYFNTSKGTYFCLENHRSILTSIYNGYTDCGTYTPVAGAEKKTVTLIGDSRIFCNTVPSRLNIPSLLQKRFMDENRNCEVKCFSALANSLQNVLGQVRSMKLGKEDIIICGTQALGTYFNIRSIPRNSKETEDTDDVIRLKLMLMREIRDHCEEKGASVVFLYLPTIEDMAGMTEMEKEIAASYGLTYKPNRSHRKLLRLCLANDIKILDVTEEFINTPRVSHYVDMKHFSIDGEKIVVNSIFEYIDDVLMRDAPIYHEREFMDEALEVHQRFVQKIMSSHIDENEDYMEYLHKLSEGKSENAGFIIMNCNPFTLGHQYLVEEAAKQVDDLYILVVPEENPHFSYKDRFEMARRAVAKYDNVHMVKGGTALGTRATFPEYFEREQNPNAVIDISKDIYTFCYQVAPALKVKKRFFGTGPNDAVTSQLNEQCRKALPDAGIAFVEIPRKELNNRPVSASDVRRWLKEKQYDKVREIVPETTYDYLRNVLKL